MTKLFGSKVKNSFAPFFAQKSINQKMMYGSSLHILKNKNVLAVGVGSEGSVQIIITTIMALPSLVTVGLAEWWGPQYGVLPTTTMHRTPFESFSCSIQKGLSTLPAANDVKEIVGA